MEKFAIIVIILCFTFTHSLPVNDAGGSAEEGKRGEISKQNVHQKKHFMGEGFDAYGHHHSMHGPAVSMDHGYPHMDMNHHYDHHYDHHQHHYNPIHHEYQFHAPNIDYWWPHHWPSYLPAPFPFHLCKDEKDKNKKNDDKKKDDKKKDDKKEKGKKTKRQLVPCHYHGPPGAGWGAPYWY